MVLGNVSAIVVLIATIIAAYTDVAKYKVYNVLTLPLILGGLVFQVATSGSSGAIAWTFGVCLALGILWLPYAVGGLGAGDVKFAMAIGAWLGPNLILPVIVIGCLATGVYALVLVCRIEGIRGVWIRVQLVSMRVGAWGKALAATDSMEEVLKAAESERRKRLIPFSAMIAIGVVVIVVSQFWW